MHQSVVCVISNEGDAEGIVNRMMEPFEKEGMTDGWQIGGRWTGFFDPRYDPERDTQNIEVCDLCRGTGKRKDSIGRAARADNPFYGCNGCDGRGKRVKWPTKWAPFKGDIVPVVAALASTDLKLPFAVIADGEWVDLYQEKGADKTYTAILTRHRNRRAVIVDVHN